jgi:hypothetical protein
MARLKTSTVTIAPTATRGRSRTAEVTTCSKSRSTSSTSTTPRPRTTVKRRVIADDPEDPLDLAVVAPPPPLPPVPVVGHAVVQPAPMEVDQPLPARAATEEDAAPYATLLDDFLAIFRHEMREQREQVTTMRQINARLDQRHEVAATDRDYDDYDDPDDDGDDDGGGRK